MLRKLWPAWIDWLLLVGWMAAIYHLSAQTHPPVPGVEFDVIRKAMHIAEYSLLFVLWWRALYHTLTWNLRWTVRVALLATVAYAVSDEVHQTFVAGRDGNVLDVLIDSVLPLSLWLRLEARRMKAPLLLSQSQPELEER